MLKKAYTETRLQLKGPPFIVGTYDEGVKIGGKLKIYGQIFHILREATMEEYNENLKINYGKIAKFRGDGARFFELITD